MSRAHGKRLNTKDEISEVPPVKEIIIKDAEDVKLVKIQSFEDLPWNSTESTGLSTRVRKWFRS